MKLLIIRHPETNKIAKLPGDPESPSTDGLRQLARITTVCRQQHVRAVFYSVLPRTTIAGMALADALRVPAFSQEGLRERNFGDWNAMDWPDIAAKLGKMTGSDRYMFVPPNGESWKEMDARLTVALQTIARSGYSVVALMTHYGAIRALLPIVRQAPKESTLSLEVANGEIFIEEYRA